MRGKKLHRFIFFGNSLVKPLSILIIFVTHYTSINFLSPTYFTFFIRSNTKKQPKFQQ